MKGAKPFDVNIRSVYSFRSIGVGYNGFEKCVGLMNIPPPMTQKNYDKISCKLTASAEKIATKSMIDAAEKAVTIKRSTDLGVSLDGTWQRRGYVSMNGIVAAISIDTGEIVDVEIMSRHCRMCEMKRRELEDEKFSEWYESHKSECGLNHNGTAPAMESEGVKRIFERSIAERNVRYLEYYGDGDSKGFATVKDTYTGVEVVKKECIGHYQKRVGHRLLKLKKENKGLKDLTKPMIDKLQNYFGIALRSHTSSVLDMQKAILGSFLHIASSAENNFHGQCESSWCQFKKDQVNKTNLYKPGKGLSMDTVKLVRPIYMNLISSKELEKCLHGKTQNQNESFNNMIWERVPKNNYVGLEKLRLGVYDAVVNFNDGRQGTLDLFRELGIIPGYFTSMCCYVLNKRRLNLARYKSTDQAKKSRKIIKAQRKIRTSRMKKNEPKSYLKGGF